MLHRQFQMLFPALGGVDCVSKTGRVGLFTNYQYYVLSKLRYLTCLVLHHLDFCNSCQSNTSDKLPALRFAHDKDLSCLLYEYIFSTLPVASRHPAQAGNYYFPKHNLENVASAISDVVIVPSIFPIASAARRMCSANIS